MTPETRLTERQRQCLDGVLQRKTAKEIARELGITHHAVEQHLKSARRKLSAPNTREAVRIYAQAVATAEPYYGSEALLNVDKLDDLFSRSVPEEERSTLRLRDVATDDKGPVYEFTAARAIRAIGITAVGIAAALALLIAVAQGVDALIS